MHTPLDSPQFRKVMCQFVTGVTIVTGRHGNEIHGMTCNSFCSIPLDPLTVMVSLAKNTRTERLVERGQKADESHRPLIFFPITIRQS